MFADVGTTAITMADGLFKKPHSPSTHCSEITAPALMRPAISVSSAGGMQRRFRWTPDATRRNAPACVSELTSSLVVLVDAPGRY